MIVYWIFTLVSIQINSDWFTLSRHTFSKLGNPSMARHPKVFWTGLISGGILMTLYGVWLSTVGGRVATVGAAYVILSGVFMALIGPIHDGLKAHDTLALLTFIFFYAGSSLAGLGSHSVFLKIFQPAILAAAILGMALPVWVSLGALELYEIVLVMISSVLMPIFWR